MISSEKFFENKTIAVVCAGSSLIHRDYSHMIDNHDVVVRINDGILYYENHKEKVGEKLDVYACNCFVNHGNLELIKSKIQTLNQDVPIIATRPYEKVLDRAFFYIDDQFVEIFNKIKNPIWAVDANLFLQHQINNYYNFSSGLTAILYISQFNYKQINVFGFDGCMGGYFYSPKNTLMNQTNHKSAFELAKLNYLSKQYKNIKRYV